MTSTPVEAVEGPADGANLRQRAVKDVVIQVGFRIGNLALGVVVTAILVRTLGDEGFGQWFTILTTFQLVSFFASLGLDAVAIRESAADPENTNVWLGALMVTRMALTLPSMVIAVVVLLFLEESTAMLVAGLILLLQFPLSVASSLQIVHQLRLRNTIPMVVLTINSVVWGVCVLATNLSGGGLVALAACLAGCTALTAGLQAISSLRLLGVRLTSSRAAVVALIRVGAPLGVAGLLLNAYARLDQLIVYEKAGAAAAGLYGSTYRMLEQAHFVPVSLLTTLAPVIASLYPVDIPRMLRVVGLTARLLTIGSLGALAFVIVAAVPVVRLVFGEEFVPGANALPVLAAAFVFICFGYLVGNLLLVLGLAPKQIIVGLAGLVVNLTGNLLLVGPYGYMAAAWMTLVTEIVVVGIGAWYVIRKLDIERPKLVPLLRVVAAAGVLAAALVACDALGAGLVVLVPVAILVYPAALLGLGAVEKAELADVLGKRAGVTDPAVPAPPA